MISVNEALDHIFARLTALDVETIPFRAAAGRVLAKSVAAATARHRHLDPVKLFAFSPERPCRKVQSGS